MHCWCPYGPGHDISKPLTARISPVWTRISPFSQTATKRKEETNLKFNNFIQHKYLNTYHNNVQNVTMLSTMSKLLKVITTSGITVENALK